MSKVKPKKTQESKGKEEKRRIERERKRRYRESLKNNVEKLENVRKYDRERKMKDKQEGKLKSINDVSEREKRRIRKRWKEASATYRKKNKRDQELDTFIYNNTPPSSPRVGEPLQESSTSGRKVAGQRRARQRRERDRKNLQKVQKALEAATKSAGKWRKRYNRLKQKQDPTYSPSPKKIVQQIITSGPNEVRRNLMLGVVLTKQLKKNVNLCSSQEEKRKFAENISGTITSKNNLKTALQDKKIISSYYQRKACKNRGRERKTKTTHISKLKKCLSDFFEDAANTCQAPGKKEYITRKKMQKQKRYLLFSLKELHAKFVQQFKFPRISYQTFVKLRPFWVVAKKVDKRDTCVCVTHANFKFKLQKLKLLKLIKTDSINQILKNSVCDTQKIGCMSGTCETCSLQFSEEILSDDRNFEDFTTFYYRWCTKEEIRKSKKGDKMKKVKLTVKEKILCKASELMNITEKDLKTIAIHSYNMHHQHTRYKRNIKRMTNEEALIICDWSENYSCKYGEEIQAIHFGASRNQVSLHTGIVYIGNTDVSDKEEFSFCTISDSPNHRASAMWAHLVPILSLIRNEHPNINVLHFFTDGPTSQYRNKTNFFLMCKVCSDFGFELCSWNFWEAGHGKGPADGIGGLVKRTADKAVAMGRDVTDAVSFLNTISNLNIKKFLVQEENIKLMEDDYGEKEENILAIKGTLKLKSVVWSKFNKCPFSIHLRKFSCSNCRKKFECKHYPFVPSTWDLMKEESTVNLNNTLGIEENSVDNSRTSTRNICKRGTSTNFDKKQWVYSDVYSSDSEESVIGNNHEKEVPNLLKRAVIVKEEDFIVVKLQGKKSFRHYVAKVLVRHLDGDLSVSFMRKSLSGKFTFPQIIEEKSITEDQVVKVLKLPVVSRGRFCFKDNLNQYECMN